MNQETLAIKKHLGLQIDDGQLNHYTLLGLESNASNSEIKQALRTAVSAWNNSNPKSHPDSAPIVAKLIKQAQAVLLDETLKSAYDLQLDRTASSKMQSLFPDADPYAAFNVSAYLVGAGATPNAVSYGTPSQRWSKLEQLIPALRNAEATGDSLEEFQELEEDKELEEHEELEARSIVGLAKPPRESAATIVERLQRKRKRNQRLYLTGILVLAASFLCYAGVRFILNRQELAQRGEADAKGPQEKNNPISPQDKVMKSMGGNFAPKVAGNSPNLVLPTLSKEDTPEGTPMEFTEDNPFGNSPQAPVPSVPAIDPPPVESMPGAAPPSTTAPALPPIMTPAMTPAVTMPSTGAPPTSPESKAKWISTMKSAKEAVDKADFKTFHTNMEVALPLCENEEMTAKHARLDQLGQLYEIFIKAVQDAKSKMRGTETLSVGKSLINIVEIKSEELIVRIQGKNERFPWDRLPPGIANALADFSLSDQEPTDIAARAVYFSLSPARNELSSKKVQEWFDKSVGKGAVRKDLLQALTDTYE